MAPGEAWVGVIGALGGVAGTGLIGLATAAINRWTADDRDTEDAAAAAAKRAAQRQEAYVGFLAAVDALHTAVTATAGSWSESQASKSYDDRVIAVRNAHVEVWDGYDLARRRVELLAGDDVRRRMEAFADATVQDMAWYVVGQRREVDHEVDTRKSLERELLDAMREEIES